MSIKKRLPLMLIAMVSIPLLILSFVIYNYTYTSITNTSKKNIQQVTCIEGNALNTFLNSQIREVQLSAKREIFVQLLLDVKNTKNIREFTYEPDTLNADRIMDSRIREIENVQHSFISDMNGNIIADSNSNGILININDREYFQKAIAGEITVSSEIQSKIGGEKIIVIASPILDKNGNVIGLFGNSIRIAAFDEFLSNIKVGKTGYAYLVDNNGIIISHPSKDKLGQVVNSSAIQKMFDSNFYSDKFETVVDTYTYDNKQKYVGMTVLPKLRWILAVTQNIEEINAPAKLELYIIGAVTLIMMIISAISSIIASNSITKPITKLIQTISKADSGDLDVKCDYESNDELGQLSNKFNKMIKKLSNTYDELSSVYEELSATEEELRAQYDELLENQKALVKSEDRFKQALDAINDAVWEWDAEKNIFFASDKWESITDYSSNNIDIKQIMNKENPDHYLSNIIESIMLNSDKNTGYFRDELQIMTKDSGLKWVLSRGKIIKYDDGSIKKVFGAISDYTIIKGANDRIKELAYYDALTGIPNRNAFLLQLDEIIDMYVKHNMLGALFFIDLDDFKKINDSLGHDIGDKLLKAISSKITDILDETETLCRFGGDEFLLLKRDVTDKNHVADLAKQLLCIFDNNFNLDGKQVFITGSVGICMFPVNGDDKNIILKNADTAMYKAKEKGKNRYEFYNEEMSQLIIKKMLIEKALRVGLKNNEFYLNFQPQVNLKTGKIVGFESLIRLKNDELGFVSPGDFIPIAEENGLIIPIGDWVMETACKKNIEWISKGYEHTCMAINVSSLQIHEADFLEKIKNLITRLGILPQFIELEITESVLMEDMKENVKILQELRNMGIKTALDDFGTGYSSLNYLRMIPIDTLKIDKSFVDDICVNEKQGAIVDGIIEMAHKLGMKVVAEGIETTEQLEVLSQKNCDVIQGYVFCKPLMVDEVEKLLQVGEFNVGNRKLYTHGEK